MKTRTLLLLALGCGLAIMVAGAVFLFQLTTQDDPAEPVPLGELTDVGDMQVAVLASREADGHLRVDVELGGVRDDAPAADFRLIASGRPEVPVDTTCTPTGPAIQTCSVAFDVALADGVSRVLFYERGDERARWVLG